MPVEAQSPTSIEPSSCLLSLEEFREIYVNQQRKRFKEYKSSVTSPSEPLSQQHTLNRGIQQEQEQQPEFQQDVFLQAAEQRNANHQWIRDFLSHAGEVAGQVFLATLLFFHTVTPYYLMAMFSAYIVWACICRFLSLVQIEREDRNRNRAPLHQAAAEVPEANEAAMGNGGKTETGQGRVPQRASAAHRAFYIGVRCLTSFVLSISPTFSIEQLELELVEDGIVVDPFVTPEAGARVQRN